MGTPPGGASTGSGDAARKLGAQGAIEWQSDGDTGCSQGASPDAGAPPGAAAMGMSPMGIAAMAIPVMASPPRGAAVDVPTIGHAALAPASTSWRANSPARSMAVTERRGITFNMGDPAAKFHRVRVGETTRGPLARSGRVKRQPAMVTRRSSTSQVLPGTLVRHRGIGGSFGRRARLVVCVCRTTHRVPRRSRMAVPPPMLSTVRPPTSPPSA